VENFYNKNIFQVLKEAENKDVILSKHTKKAPDNGALFCYSVLLIFFAQNKLIPVIITYVIKNPKS